MNFSNYRNRSSLLKFLGILYTAWAGFWFVAILILHFPFHFIFLQKQEWKRYSHYLIRLWGKWLFFLLAMPIKVKYDFIPEKKGTYVFVSNHFSYWDIATMGTIIDNYYAFVGKASVKNIPLLGFVFTKLHIQVDRSEKESRAKSITRAMGALKEGRSMMMFAEGGIVTRNPPQMVAPLKDGAFLLAIQNQVPIVPITLYTHHQIIWDEELIMSWLPIRARVHRPISTIGLKTSNMDELREKTWKIIQDDLNDFHGIKTEQEKTTRLV